MKNRQTTPSKGLIKLLFNQIKNKGSPKTFIFPKKLSNIWNIISKERKVVYYIITNFV